MVRCSTMVIVLQIGWEQLSKLSLIRVRVHVTAQFTGKLFTFTDTCSVVINSTWVLLQCCDVLYLACTCDHDGSQSSSLQGGYFLNGRPRQLDQIQRSGRCTLPHLMSLIVITFYNFIISFSRNIMATIIAFLVS